MKLAARMSRYYKQGNFFSEFASVCAEAGYDAVDCPTMNSEIEAECRKRQLGIGSVDVDVVGLQDPDEAKRNAALITAKAAVGAIAEAGGRVAFVVIAPPDKSTPRAKSFAIWKETWPDFVAHCETVGVRVAIEPWPGPAPVFPNLGTTPEMLRAMFAAVPSPALSLCYDPSHFARLQVDYLRVLEEFAPRIAHVHLKDTEFIAEGLYKYGILGPSFEPPGHVFGGGFWRYALVGDGIVDWTKVLRRLADHGYDGLLSVELEDDYYAPTPDLAQLAFRTALERMRALGVRTLS